MTTLAYVVPVHNQAQVLRQRMATLVERLATIPGSEVVMVENASQDDSASLTAAIASEAHPGVTVIASSSGAGLGRAYRTGIAQASADVIVLTAADLPFGFSDLDSWLESEPRPALAIGSKAHPRSLVDRTWHRRLMSTAFRWLRRGLLGLRVGDSQGTLIIERAVAQAILPHLRSDDFLISTEIVAWAARAGVVAVELPVVYHDRGGRSTVSPWHDSLAMALGLWHLRGRLRQSSLDTSAVRPGDAWR